MAVVADKVFNEALSLPSDARMSLVEKLLASLNLPTHAEIDRLWAEEAKRRVSQIDRGDVTSHIKLLKKSPFIARSSTPWPEILILF